MAGYRIISGDSHFVEPPNMWAERIDAKFRDRAPHTVQGHNGQEGEFFVCENITPIPVAGFFGSGKSAEELPAHRKRGFEVAPKSVWDPAERPYSLPDYDPFWAAAQDLGMPLSLHIITGRRGVQLDPRRVLYRYMKLPQEIQLSFADLIVGGVLERFPRLKLVSAENDISWVPHFMYRLDHAYDRLRHFEGLTLPMLPSEYMKRNVTATFQFETTNVDFTRQIFGAENIVWSSDYPHTDSTWPRSRDMIAQAFKGIPEGDVQKIVGGNVARLYGVN